MIVRVRFQQFIAPVAAAFLLCVSVARVYGDQSGLAYVESYNGPANAYLVRSSSGQVRKIAPLLPLESGYRLSVVRAGSAENRFIIRLKIGGQPYVVDTAHSPFCIGMRSAGCSDYASLESGAPNATLKVVKNVLSSIASLFGQVQDQYPEQVEETIHQVGACDTEVPSIPMLPASPQALVASDLSAIAFAWQGGQPTFDVKLSEVAGTGIPIALMTNRTNLVLTGVHLKAGKSYELKITDSLKQTTGAVFKAISPHDLPKLSVVPTVDAPDGLVRAGLLSLRGHQWYLAAYQKIALTPDDPQHLVSNFRRWLATGRLPASRTSSVRC